MYVATATPMISSITIRGLSFSPTSRSASPATHTPPASTAPRTSTEAHKDRTVIPHSKSASGIPRSDPTVPGPTGESPAYAPVATKSTARDRNHERDDLDRGDMSKQ